jgi:hypothetical protein
MYESHLAGWHTKVDSSHAHLCRVAMKTTRLSGLSRIKSLCSRHNIHKYLCTYVITWAVYVTSQFYSSRSWVEYPLALNKFWFTDSPERQDKTPWMDSTELSGVQAFGFAS